MNALMKASAHASAKALVDARRDVRANATANSWLDARFFQKWYTRIIGVFFVLVSISLILDFITNGHTPETWHKVFHVLLGVIVLFNWNDFGFYRGFCLWNGAFFSFVALFGWVWMDFAGLDAFNFIDTILHSIVGVSGLVIVLLGEKGLRERK